MKLPVPPRSLMVFLSKVKVFWREWDVQTMVLTSFAMQLILILVAPFRKRTSNQIVVVSIWLAYLLADWVAAQGIGLIARPCGSMKSAEAGSAELYAFWGQFLLLHLGGPDTITALALEDNELWLRTGLHLGAQVYGGLGVLVKSIAQYGSNLWVPTILMFMAGVLKYLERVTSLFHGRLLKFCSKDLEELDDPNSDSDSIPILREIVKIDELTNVGMVRSAYCLFNTYKGLYADQELPTRDKCFSFRSFSEMSSPEAAFKQAEIQLNFAYEAFYTKTVIIHTSRSWKVLRFLVASLLVGCLAIWLFFTNKQGFLHYNVQITYTLLIGAIIAELLAFVRLQLSDWTIGQSKKASTIKIQLYEIFLSAYQKRTWGRYWPYLTRLLFGRWSESMSQLNMISMCMDKPRPHKVQKVIDFFMVKDVADRCKYVSHKWFSNHLRSFIFEDIKRITIAKLSLANIGHTKGGMAFRSFEEFVKFELQRPDVDASNILNATLQLFNVRRRAYNEILTSWHIITELCYVKSKGRDTDTEKQLEEDNLKVEDYREICKTLSDYLFSLLIYQPEMMPTMAATKQMLQDLMTMLKAIKEALPAQLKAKNKEFVTNDLRPEFCEYIREQQPSSREKRRETAFPVDDIMSELEELEEVLGELAKWKLMAEVWAELLYYAALRCKPRLHAAKLKQGGELLSVVWILLLQFGCSLDEVSYSLEKLGETLPRPETALLCNHVT